MSTRPTLVERLHAVPLRTQIIVLVCVAPVVFGAVAHALVPVAVDVAVERAPVDRAVVRTTVSVALGIAFAVGAVAAAASAILLRASFASVVDAMRDATAAIANGSFDHRVGIDRDDDLGQLARDIDRMAERLESLEVARRRMLAAVSHELRTPLTVIHGQAYTLARDETSDARRGRLATIDRECIRLARLIDELLDAASLHAGGMPLRPVRCDASVLARDAVDRFRSSADTASVALRFEPARAAVPVVADPERLHQVFANLVSNAIRHADPESVVALRVDADRLGDVVQVDVENVGTPLPDDVERLFEPFEQGGEVPGRVGLGLAIAAQLVRAHGGTISATSTGRHSRFTVRIPLSAPGRGLRVAVGRV